MRIIGLDQEPVLLYPRDQPVLPPGLSWKVPLTASENQIQIWGCSQHWGHVALHWNPNLWRSSADLVKCRLMWPSWSSKNSWLLFSSGIDIHPQMRASGKFLVAHRRPSRSPSIIANGSTLAIEDDYWDWLTVVAMSNMVWCPLWRVKECIQFGQVSTWPHYYMTRHKITWRVWAWGRLALFRSRSILQSSS